MDFTKIAAAASSTEFSFRNDPKSDEPQPQPQPSAPNPAPDRVRSGLLRGGGSVGALSTVGLSRVIPEPSLCRLCWQPPEGSGRKSRGKAAGACARCSSRGPCLHDLLTSTPTIVCRPTGHAVALLDRWQMCPDSPDHGSIRRPRCSAIMHRLRRAAAKEHGDDSCPGMGSKCAHYRLGVGLSAREHLASRAP